MLKKILCSAVIILILFVAVSFLEGGKPFRWFGAAVMEAGKVVNDKCLWLAERADIIKGSEKGLKEKADNIQQKAKELVGD